MSTLLKHTSRPLWVWIIVIVIGSFFVLGISALIIRLLIIRQRSRHDVELISDEPAEKKLTLRRGRTVPANNYLSLTGSRFGMNSYAADDGLRSPSVRSRSPFEWWTNLRGRHSRLSYVSHMSSSQYPSSPRTGSLYLRAEHSTSKLSLTSKDESIRSTIIEIHRPQATLHVPSLKRISRSFEPVNFSRSFTPQTQRSLAATRNQTLSRIDEKTPRQSMFSTASIKARLNSHSTSQNSPMIMVTEPQNSDGVSFLDMPPSIFTHSRNGSAQSLGNAVQVRVPIQHSRSPSLPSSPTYLSSAPTTPTFPEPIAPSHPESVGRQSLWNSSMKQFPWLEEHHHYHQHQHEPITQDLEAEETTDEHLYNEEQTIDHILSNPLVIRYPSSIMTDYDHFTAKSQPTFQSPYTQPRLQSRPPSSLPVGLGISSPLFRTRTKKGNNVLRKKSIH